MQQHRRGPCARRRAAPTAGLRLQGKKPSLSPGEVNTRPHSHGDDLRDAGIVGAIWVAVPDGAMVEGKKTGAGTPERR